MVTALLQLPLLTLQHDARLLVRSPDCVHQLLSLIRFESLVLRHLGLVHPLLHVVVELNARPLCVDVPLPLVLGAMDLVLQLSDNHLLLQPLVQARLFVVLRNQLDALHVLLASLVRLVLAEVVQTLQSHVQQALFGRQLLPQSLRNESVPVPQVLQSHQRVLCVLLTALPHAPRHHLVLVEHLLLPHSSLLLPVPTGDSRLLHHRQLVAALPHHPIHNQTVVVGHLFVQLAELLCPAEVQGKQRSTTPGGTHLGQLHLLAVAGPRVSVTGKVVAGGKPQPVHVNVARVAD